MDDATYRELHGEEFEVVVRRARSRAEMDSPPPEWGKAPQRLPWAEAALRQEPACREEWQERGGEE